MQELAAAAPYWPQLGHLELNLRVGSQINVALTAAAHYWRKLTSLQLGYRVCAASASPLHTLAGHASSWPLLQRLALHADHGIGPGPVLDSRGYTFLNTHSTVRVERCIGTMFYTSHADTCRSRPKHAKGRYVYPAYASRVS